MAGYYVALITKNVKGGYTTMLSMVCTGKVLRLANISVLSKLPVLVYYWKDILDNLDNSVLHASYGLGIQDFYLLCPRQSIFI